jgi:hypothetical protein
MRVIMVSNSDWVFIVFIFSEIIKFDFYKGTIVDPVILGVCADKPYHYDFRNKQYDCDYTV